MYITIQEAAKKWSISDRHVRALCEAGKIPGVICKGRSYQIPVNALNPADGRNSLCQPIPQPFAACFSRIDALKTEISRRRPLNPGELARLQEEFIIEYTYNSNAIEGNTLTLKETALVLSGLTIDQKPYKDHLEATGHRDAFLYIEELTRQDFPFSELIIKQINARVLMDRPQERGAYRRHSVRILGAFHQPPDPLLVPDLVLALIKDFEEKKLHPLEHAALFHLLFEGIHPFVDGNGRTGRLILNLTLMKNGFPPISVKFTDRSRYYDAFDSYHKDGSSAEMTELIAGYVEERLEGMLSLLQ